MGTLLVLMLLAAGLVALPLLLLKLVFALVLLPFKLLGAVFQVFFGLLGGLFRVGFGLAVALVTLVAVLFFMVVLPLLPFLLIAGFVWLVARATRPRPALRVVS